jgi:hypothetical protein
MISGSELLYFARNWSESLKNSRIGIAPLEALAVVVAAGIWGHSWSGRNVVLRSDSTDACFALNTLKTRNPIMEYILDLWEDIQFRHGFNGVVTHCPQGHNRIADLASRKAEDGDLPARLLAKYKSLCAAADSPALTLQVRRELLPQDIPGVPPNIDTILTNLAATLPQDGEGLGGK